MASTESPDKPRVLIFHPALAPYRIDLFNALARRVQLRLIFLNRNVTYQSYDQEGLLAGLNADYRYLDQGLSIFGRELRFGIAREIADFQPAAIVTHEFSPTTLQVLAYRLLKNRPHIVWTADNPNMIRSDIVLRRIARKLVISNVHGLVVYSEETKTVYEREMLFEGSIGVCPNVQVEGSIQGKLRDALEESKSLAAFHELFGKKILLYVGRLAKVKRLDRLIDAFASSCDDVRRSVLVLVGDGPERATLQVMVDNLGIASKVIFVGHCEGRLLYAWFNLGSLLALTSESETWGAVVNEALITGVPVICTSQAGARVLITPGVNGVVVDANNPVALKMALTEWMDKVSPLDAEQMNSPRASLMTQKFSDAVAGFMSPLTNLLRNEKKCRLTP